MSGVEVDSIRLSWKQRNKDVLWYWDQPHKINVLAVIVVMYSVEHNVIFQWYVLVHIPLLPTHALVHTYIHMCMHAHAHICTHTCTHTHIYTYIYSLSLLNPFLSEVKQVLSIRCRTFIRWSSSIHSWMQTLSGQDSGKSLKVNILWSDHTHLHAHKDMCAFKLKHILYTSIYL